MIIPFINQARLISDTSQQEITRIVGILKDAEIEYYLKTSGTGGGITAGRITDAKASVYSKYNTITDNVGKYVYTVCVKRMDKERALMLIKR